MLQYQRGEYCICIWDAIETDLGEALKSLSKYTEDERATQEDQGFTVTAWTFDQGTEDDKIKRVLTKAIDVMGALHYEGRESKEVIYELAATVTACLNLVEALGYNAEEFQKHLNLVKESNTREGRA